LQIPCLIGIDAPLERSLATSRIARQRGDRKQQDPRTGYAPIEHGVGKINLSLPHVG
jgi:hypothetical protein